MTTFRFAALLALASFSFLAGSSPAIAQIAAGTPAKAPAGYLPGQASYCSADGGTTWTPCSGGGGGGGGGGDASIANQLTQIGQLADVQASGTIALATPSAANTITIANGRGTVGYAVTGLSSTGAVLTPEATNDGTNWVAIGGVYAGTGLSFTTLTADASFRLNASGRRALRLRVTTTGSGTVTAASTQSVVAWDAPSPARDGNGDLRLPTVTLTPFFVSFTASTSTSILTSSAARIGFDIQCNGVAVVAVSRTGATLSSITPSSGGADLRIPATADTFFAPQYVSTTQAVTGYTTGTGVTCWGMSYARQ